MDFSLGFEQQAIQKSAEEFARGEFTKDLALEHERNHGFPYEIWKKACELGFVGIHFPEQYGGQGYGLLENALVVVTGGCVKAWEHDAPNSPIALA